MRSMKLLAMVAGILMTIAFAVAGSAAAGTLCEENVGSAGTCPVGKRITEGTVIEAHSKVNLFYSESFNITCDSNLKFKVGKNLGSSVAGKVETLSLEKCTGVGTEWCQTQEFMNLPLDGKVQSGKNGDGEFLIDSNLQLRFTKCGPPHIVTCDYSVAVPARFGTFEGSIPSGIMAVQNLSLQAPKEQKYPCVTNYKMTAGYANTKMAFEGHASETILTNNQHGVLSTCAEPVMTGSMASISGLVSGSCTGVCTSTKALNAPYSANYTPIGPGEGTLSITKPTLEYSNCPLGIRCQYTSDLVLDVTGGNQLVAKEEPLTQWEVCSMKIQGLWSGTFAMSGPVLSLAALP